MEMFKFSYNSLLPFLNSKDEVIVFTGIDIGKQSGFTTKSLIIEQKFNSTLDILIKKLEVMLDIPDSEECCVVDIDTEFTNKPTFHPEYPMFHQRETKMHMYLDSHFSENTKKPDSQSCLDQLENFTKQELDVTQYYWREYYVYNTGMIYLPIKNRKIMINQAISMINYINSDSFPRYRQRKNFNRLDEQTAISFIANLHYGYGKNTDIKTASHFLNHYWLQKDKNKIWWN